MFYFYILFSSKDKRWYYGYTSDLKRRKQEHDTGGVNATKHRRPLTLLYYEAYHDKRQAQKREHDVKQSGRIRKELKERLAQNK